MNKYQTEILSRLKTYETQTNGPEQHPWQQSDGDGF